MRYPRFILVGLLMQSAVAVRGVVLAPRPGARVEAGRAAKTGLGLFRLLAAAVALTGVLAIGVSGGPATAGTFEGTDSFKLCNDLPAEFVDPALAGGGGACTEDSSPGANPDFTFFHAQPHGDYNFDSLAIFLSDEFDIADDGDIPDGTKVGGVRWNMSLGLANSSCSFTFLPDFILYDSTTDTSMTVDALPEGTANRFSNLKTDGGDAFPGVADADSPAVLLYPSFLNTLLDPDLDYPGGPNGPEPPIILHARYTGLAQVPPGGDWVFLSILVLHASQLAPFAADPDNAIHPLARYAGKPDSLGWVHVLVVQDPTQQVGAPSPMSDFCTPTTLTGTLLGVVDTNGDTLPDTSRITSPPPMGGIDGQGTHLVQSYGQSVRDTDGDGLENSFDTCPFVTNIDDPRATGGTDGDMIDSACDPDPNTNENFNDLDSDGFLNAQDNCPLVFNPSQFESENASPYVLAAPDGGPRADALGDDCDSEQGGSDFIANGRFLREAVTDAFCIGGADNDDDGWCAGGADPDDSNPNVTGAPDQDTDGDGYDDGTEAYLGTDPLDDCPDYPGHDTWPPDLNQDGIVHILDVGYYLPPNPGLGLVYGDPEWSPAVQRLDINVDGAVSAVSDLWYYVVGHFGQSCVGGGSGPPVLPEGDPVTMGIDPDILNNSANTLGDLESCVRVDVDPASLDDGVADHTIDVYVTGDTAAPAGYDAWVAYDPGRVDPVSWDALIKLPGASDATHKKTSRLNAAAYYTSGSGTAGDGTIVRINLDAISAGPACFAFGYVKAYSGVNEIHPTYPQAAMAAINEDCPTEDLDGDDVFDVCDNCLGDVNSGQEDFDGDGLGDVCDNCWDVSNAGQEDFDVDTVGNPCDNCPTTPNTDQYNTDGDQWGDACDNCPDVATSWLVPPGDSDCDAFTDTDEGIIGTDPLDPCADTVTANDEADDKWPPDFDDNQIINILDVGNVLPPVFGSSPGAPDTNGDTIPDWSQRADIAPDGYINILDVGMTLPPVFGQSCTP